MSSELQDSPPVDGNDVFSAPDEMSQYSADTMQDQPFDPETAVAPRDSAGIPEEESQPVEVAPEEPKEAVQGEPSAAPVGTPGQQSAQPAPASAPPWLKEVLTEANKPANQLFEALRQQQEANRVAQEQRQQQALIQARAAERQKIRDLQRPIPPDFDSPTLTAKQVSDYTRAVAEFEARVAREDAMEETKSYLQRIEQRLDAQQKEQQEQMLRAESARIDQYISQTMERFASDPSTKFMQNPAVQEMFMAQWWAANARSPNGMVDPGQIMSQFKSSMAAFQQSAQVVQKRNEQTTIDQNRRNEQAARGAPKTAQRGSPQPPKSQDDPFDKHWLETHARVM